MVLARFVVKVTAQLVVSILSTKHWLFLTIPRSTFYSKVCCPTSRGDFLWETYSIPARIYKMMVCCCVRKAVVSTNVCDMYGCFAGPSNINCCFGTGRTSEANIHTYPSAVCVCKVRLMCCVLCLWVLCDVCQMCACNALRCTCEAPRMWCCSR